MKFQGYPVTQKYSVTNNNTTLSNIIPKGNEIAFISVYNKEATPITVSISTSVGGKEIISDEIVASNSFINVPVNRILSVTAASTLYVTTTEVLTALGIVVVITLRFGYIV